MTAVAEIGPEIPFIADFDAVASAHRTAVFRFILASVRDADVADTLTQECLLKAYRARDQFRGDSSIRTWLMRIAVNLVRDHQSSARLRFWRRQPSLDISFAAQCVATPEASPELAAATRQQIEAVWRAAERLPEQQRTAFLLRFVEDMEILEIAQVTGLSEGTVKSHLFRAVRNIRTHLEKHQ